MRFTRTTLLGLLALLVLTACAPRIGLFNQKAYELSTATKAEALALMDKATEPAEKHTPTIQALQLNLDKGYEYARGRPQNEESTKQWEILRDPQRNSIGGFLAKWQEEKQLTTTFIEQARPQISDGFDLVIELESGKRKS
ncbi:MAG: hypothetical protein MUE84_16400, partial [Hyphomonas sp.]|nr:hypothetical protein [Hyphomonas sp.]